MKSVINNAIVIDGDRNNRMSCDSIASGSLDNK